MCKVTINKNGLTVEGGTLTIVEPTKENKTIK